MIKHIYKFCLSGVVLTALASSGKAQTPPDIIGVEEDWEMLVKNPEPTKGSPQAQTWMSPTDSLEGEHFGVDLNQVKRIDSESGGFQTKALDGETLVDNYLNGNTASLKNENETVRWTQRMILLNNQLLFEVVDGTSQTWENFGGQETRVRHRSKHLTNLNNYTPYKSLEWSGVGYAANRVAYMRLKDVRFFASDGNVYTVSINQDAK